MLLYKGRQNLTDIKNVNAVSNYDRFIAEIESNKWWHSHSDYLNDCFELLPAVVSAQNIAETFREYFINLRKNNYKEWDKLYKTLTFNQLGNAIIDEENAKTNFEIILNNIIINWKDKIGVLSLSENYPDPLMIGKYSIGGVVVEFDYDEENKSLVKVDYSHKRPTITLHQILYYSNYHIFPTKFVQYLFATKSLFWQQENEYRSLQQTGKNIGRGFISSVNGLKINRILVNPKDDGSMFNKLKCDLPDVEIVKTKLHPTDYSIIEIP